MEYLIAHKEDCAMITTGTAIKRQISADTYELVTQPCTCGGVKVSLQDLFAPPLTTAVIGSRDDFERQQREMLEHVQAEQEQPDTIAYALQSAMTRAQEIKDLEATRDKNIVT